MDTSWSSYAAFAAAPGRPPTNARGILTNRAVNIPKSQMALLEDEASWIGNLNKPGMVFKAVPDKVLKQLQRPSRTEAPPPSNSRKAATSLQATSPPKMTASTPASAKASVTEQTAPAAAVSPSRSASPTTPATSTGPVQAARSDPPSTSPSAAASAAAAPAVVTLRSPLSPTQAPAASSPPVAQRPAAPESTAEPAEIPPHAPEQELSADAELPATPRSRHTQNAHQPEAGVGYDSPEWGSQLVDDDDVDDAERAQEEQQLPQMHQAQVAPHQVVIPAPARLTIHVPSSDQRSFDDLELQLPDALLSSPQQAAQQLPRQASPQALRSADPATPGPRPGQIASSALRNPQPLTWSSPPPMPQPLENQPRSQSPPARERTTPSGRSPASSTVSIDRAELSEGPAADPAVKPASPPRRRRLMKAPVFPKLQKPRASVPTSPSESKVGDDSRAGSTTARSPPSLSRPRAESTSVGVFTPTTKHVQHSPGAHRDQANQGKTVSPAQAPAPAPAPAPSHTWKLPYDAFTSAYPDYTGDVEDFLRACYCLQGIAKNGSLASFLFDDVVRSYLDFIEYIQDDTSGTPLNLLQWYFQHAEALHYNKNVVTKENVECILQAYPEKLQSIQQITHETDKATKKSEQSAAESALTTTPAAAGGRDHPASQVSFPPGRRLSGEPMHGLSQDDAPPQSNSLLRLSILRGSGSTGESPWPHGQPSSPAPHTLYGGNLTDGDLSQSQFTSLERGKDDPSQLLLQRPAEIHSSGQLLADSPLQLPSSPIPTGAVPMGMDKIGYMLQTPASPSGPYIPSPIGDSPSLASAALNWPEGFDEGVAETPAKPTTSRKRSREEPPSAPSAPSAASAASAASAPVVPGVPSVPRLPSPVLVGKEGATEEAGAADVIVVPDEESGMAEHGPAEAITIDDHGSSSDGSEYGETSFMSIQSAAEARRPPLLRAPQPNQERRRVTLAAPDIGMVARMAAEAEAASARAGSAAAETAVGKGGNAAGEPPRKKRKPATKGPGARRSICLDKLSEFLRKKAEEMGQGRKPWMN